MHSTKTKAHGGRPPKFNEESRPITVTLPQRILDKLQVLGSDRAKAIVACVDNMIDRKGEESQGVELVTIAKGLALIIVPEIAALHALEWLRQIEISPGRHLLSVPTGTPIETLEIAIMDLIEHLQDKETGDKCILTDLRQKISLHRRKTAVSKGEILYIHTKDQDLKR